MLVAALLRAGSAHAALIDRGNGVVYDTTSGLDCERQPGAPYVGMWQPGSSAGLFQTTVGAATWAVREGAPVPEPASLALVTGALALLVGTRARHDRRS